MKIYRAKGKPIFEKMLHDTNNRLRDTLRSYRAARLLGYKFVGGTPIDALLGDEGSEIDQLTIFPIVNEIGITELRAEFPAYKRAADIEMAKPEDQRRSLWDFWLANALKLPVFFRLAKEIALIATSSAAAERLFSLLSMGHEF
jgi:hypothetical protein